MNANFSNQDSPLSRLLEDDTLTIIEGILPYCSPFIAKILAIQMKIIELKKIISGFDDEPYLRACGFEESPADLETILHSLRNSVSEEKAKQIDSILNMLRFSKMYQTWQDTFQTHPELLQLFQQGSRSNKNDSGNSSPDIFSDPSLFLLLNSAMNGDDTQKDSMKKLLDLAMKNKNGTTDFSELLSSFLKK